MKNNWKRFLKGEIAFKVEREDLDEFLKECSRRGIEWDTDFSKHTFTKIYIEVNYWNHNKLNWEYNSDYLVCTNNVINYKGELDKTPTKLIVNLEEVYNCNKWHYSCVDYLLLSGRKKIDRKESYSADIRDNDIFKIARDTIDHSRREMAKTSDTPFSEIYDSLTDEQKELVHYLVGAALNERNKGE